MCNASLVAAAGMATSVAGTLTSSFGAYGEARAQQASLEYQAAVARNNAEFAEWQAGDAVARGEKEWQRHRLKVAGLKGTQRAVMASRGVDLGEGTPARILTDTDFLGALDAEIIRENAGREAYGYRRQAQQYGYDAEVHDYSRRNIHPGLAAAGQLLTGGSQVAERWYQFRDGGAS